MVKEKSQSVRRPRSFERAPNETARLFAGLESFANLGDSFEEFCKFAEQWPTFCPIVLRKSSGEVLPLFPHKAIHELVIRFRDFLRLVWRRDLVALRQQVPKVLLGLEYKTLGSESLPGEEVKPEIAPGGRSSAEALVGWQQRRREQARETLEREDEESRSGKEFPEFDPGIRHAVWLLMHDREAGYCRPWSPFLVADWERGELGYEPANDFQRAVYSLFRQSWRARFCRECQRPFIAEKHPQMFCGIACSTIARRKRDLAFWKSTGSVLRRKRNRKRGGAKANR